MLSPQALQAMSTEARATTVSLMQQQATAMDLEPKERAILLHRLPLDQSQSLLHAMHPIDRVATLQHLPPSLRHQNLAQISDCDGKASFREAFVLLEAGEKERAGLMGRVVGLEGRLDRAQVKGMQDVVVIRMKTEEASSPASATRVVTASLTYRVRVCVWQAALARKLAGDAASELYQAKLYLHSGVHI